MKRLLLIFLTAALPLLAAAKKGILRYEYSDGESYYTLEINTRGVDPFKHGRLCVYYVDLEYLIVETAELALQIHRIRDDGFFFHPYSYLLHGDSRRSAEIWSEQMWGLMFDDMNVPDDFFFKYDMKNKWQLLEYGYCPDDMEQSAFFHRFRRVEWFPQWMTRVKKFDYGRFPEDARREIKKRRLK